MAASLKAGRVAFLAAISAVSLLPAAAAAPARPGFAVRPATALTTSFRWGVTDYALRCGEGPVRLVARSPAGWRASVNGGDFHRGRFSERIASAPGRRSVVAFRRGTRTRRFHLRCLPRDFPSYAFHRERPGGPAYIFMQLPRQYAAIFDRNGVPVWWFKASGVPTNFQLMSDGTVSLIPVHDRGVQEAVFEVRSLTGRRLRRVGNHGGGKADVHELLRLRNGNYLLGRRLIRNNVDASQFGRSADARVIDIEIQEVTPAGRVVWRWNSSDHIALSETGRFWGNPILADEPYDIVHWNSVDIRGDLMILSFRHLDAVYGIDRETGDIRWKLGGTTTPESLDVSGDPEGDFPFGAQHDARFLPDGTVSVFDNGVELQRRPRVVRYRINRAAGRATLVQGFGDDSIRFSGCCGSARLLPRGHWLVAWGGRRLVAAYDEAGRRLFTLKSEKFPYRATPATSRQLSIGRLRRAMDAMYRR